MKAKMFIVLLVAIIASAGVTYKLTKGSPATPAAAANTEEPAAEGAHKGVQIAGLKISPAIAGKGWDTVVVTGKVTVPPDKLVQVSPRIEGKLVAVHHTAGDTVRAGEVLAVISSVELAEARAQYRQALARLSAAQKNLEREEQIAKLGAVSVRPLEEARAETLAAQSELSDAKTDLLQAKSEQASAEIEEAKCKARLERAKDLYADKIISKQDLEAAETDYRKDSAAVDSAKAKVQQENARIEHAKSKADLAGEYLTREQKVYSGKVVDLRSIQTAKSEVASARIDVESAADKIRVLGASPSGKGETIAITAPMTGRIVTRNKNVGEMATPADAIFTVANLSRVWVEADVYEKDIAAVHPGQSAEIRVDAFPNRVFSGRIDSVGDILSADTRTAKVRCVIPNPGGLLRGEMFAHVSLITGTRNSTVLIPKEAVLDDTGKKVVFVPCMDCPEDKAAGKSACGAYDKLDVEIGPQHGNLLEIKSGIQPGVMVVTAGQYQIKTALGSGQLEAGCTDH